MSMVKYQVLLAIVIVPALASAETDTAPLKTVQPTLREQPSWGARSRLTCNFGLFTPIGEAGFEYARLVRPFLEVSAGAGFGLGGPQVAIMPRLRTAPGPVSLSVGAGLSGGPYHEWSVGICLGDGPCRDGSVKATLLWTNAEAGIEWRTHDGLSVRLSGGVGHVLAHGLCRNGDCDRVNGMMLPYGGLALGRAF